MPYVSKDIRRALGPIIEHLATAIEYQGGGTFESEAGILNYTITRLILELFPRKSRYHQYALVRGVLGDVQAEFYRRKTVAYEDMKIATQGDVY